MDKEFICFKCIKKGGYETKPVPSYENLGEKCSVCKEKGLMTDYIIKKIRTRDKELIKINKETKKEFENIILPDLREVKLIERTRIRNIFRRSEVIKDLKFGVKKAAELTGINYNFNSMYEEVKKIVDSYSLPKKPMGILTSKKAQAESFYGMQPIYYDRAGLWWLWNEEEKYWEITDEVDILNMIENTSNADIITSKSRTEIINALKQTGRKNKPKEVPKTWIQFQDIIVDIKTNKKFKANHEFLITNPIPWELGKSKETPVMDKIFLEWVGEDKKEILYEILAYCLIPDYPIHRLFCFIGEGLNGKSCFLNLLVKFIGSKNATSTDLDILIDSRFEIAKLHKKLVCIMGETNFAEISKTSMLKKLTGQDMIGFEYKRKDPFEDYNYAKILIATNNLPTTTDKTLGFYRRWAIIDFPNKFSEDIDILSTIPEEEFNNLALKSIDKLKDILENKKFTNEGNVEERAKIYEDKSNPFDKFWDDNIEENNFEFIFKKEFKEKLDGWCMENRFRRLSDVFISKRMKEIGIVDEKKQADWYTKEGEKPRFNAWVGIKWKS